MLNWLIAHPNFFTWIMMFLSFLACFTYLAAGDIRRFLYWFAAGVLTATLIL